MGLKTSFLTLLFLGAAWSVPTPQIHNLHYIYTALSQSPQQSGLYKFTAMGILNDRPIDYYNSERQEKIALQPWMKENTDEDYWKKGTQSRKSKEQWFDVNVNILIDRMRENRSDVHILQWMHGCEAEETPGGLKFRKGFDQYGYDGEDFLSFDINNMAWVAPVQEAQPTKRKWDNEHILSQYTKGYLETDCMQWLNKFIGYQKEEYERQSPPEVYIFSKKSIRPDHRHLVCLATGFYPKDVVVDIFKDAVRLSDVDGVMSSGVRPNGDKLETYQLRKTLEIATTDPAKYSCKIEHQTLKEPILKFWDKEADPDYKDNTAIIAAVVAVLLFLIGVAIVLFVLKRKGQIGGGGGREQDGEVAENLQNQQQNELDQLQPPEPASNKSSEECLSDSGRGSAEGSQEAVAPLMINGDANQSDPDCNGEGIV